MQGRENDEFAGAIGTPQAAGQERSTATEQLPQEFRKVTRHLAGMNKKAGRLRRIIDRRGPSGNQDEPHTTGPSQ